MTKRRSTTPRTPKSPFEIAAMSAMVPFVIGSRLFGIALNPGSARVQAEMNRMVAEKTRAGYEAASAASFQLMRDGWRIFDAVSKGNAAALAAAGDRLAAKTTRPYSKRVRANAKRLSRRSS